MRKFLVVLILITAAPPVFAADCEPQLIDSRYGVISQMDYRLGKAGLFNEGVSNLCGPLCLINAVTKVRVVMNLPAVDPVAELTHVMNDIVPLAGLD